jgi:hypothetical protein
MAKGSQFEPKGTRQPVIRPDVKAMIDRVIVPILVRDYLEVLRREKQVEVKGDSVTPYVSANTALAEKALAT